MTQQQNTFNENVALFRHYLDALTGRTLASIEWDNLPVTIDPIAVERNYFYRSCNIGFIVEEGPVVLGGFGEGDINIYDIPVHRTVTAPNGFTAELDPSNSIITWNNVLRTPSYPNVVYYARKLANIDRVLGMNLDVHKTPWLMQADKDLELAVRNMFAQIDNGEKALVVDPDMDVEDKLKVLNLNAPLLFRDLRVLLQDTFAEALESEGILGSHSSKAERLNVVETLETTAGVRASRNDKLKARRPLAEWLTKYCKEWLPDPEKPVTVRFCDDALDLVERHAATTTQAPYDDTINPADPGETEVSGLV